MCVALLSLQWIYPKTTEIAEVAAVVVIVEVEKSTAAPAFGARVTAIAKEIEAETEIPCSPAVTWIGRQAATCRWREVGTWSERGMGRLQLA